MRLVTVSRVVQFLEGHHVQLERTRM